jgi:ABC-type amino acid transport substrate-binding protein
MAKITQEVLVEAYGRLGIDVSFSSFPAKRSIFIANEGNKYDGEIHRIGGIEKKYTNLLKVPVPIYLLEGIVISNELSFEVNGWESLKTYNIGVRRGVVFSVKGTQGMKRTILNSNEHLFQMLSSKRLDLIVLSRINSYKYLLDEKNKNLKVLNPPVQVYKMYHYLHKKNAHILPIISIVLKEMQKERLIQKIKENFLKEEISNRMVD